jgi:hypothetical protein
MVATACLQCGTPAGRTPHPRSVAGAGCRTAIPRERRRAAGLPHLLPAVDDDGRLASLDVAGLRVDLHRHLAEHDRHPVGDDEWLESLRLGDRIRIGALVAPFDVVRRYLVTGMVEGGRRRVFEHNTIVTAMTQIKRFGPNATIFGDQPEWQAARAAVSELMERYHLRRR